MAQKSNADLRDEFLKQFEELGAESSPALEEVINKHTVISQDLISSVLSKSGIKNKAPSSYNEVYFLAWFLFLQGDEVPDILKKIPGLKKETVDKWLEINRWEDKRMMEMHLLHQETERQMAVYRDDRIKSVAESVTEFADKIEKKIYASLDDIDVKDLLRNYLPAMKLKATLSGEMDNALDDESAEKVKAYRLLNESLNEVKGQFKPTSPVIEARFIEDVSDDETETEEQTETISNKTTYTF